MDDLFSKMSATQDYLEEQGDVVDSIYKINEEYKEELNKPKPDPNKLVKLLNKQLMRGLMLQMYN